MVEGGVQERKKGGRGASTQMPQETKKKKIKKSVKKKSTFKQVRGVCPGVKRGFVGEAEQLLQGGTRTQPR